MLPTLNEMGDIVIIDRLLLEPIRRGDIVVAEAPNRRGLQVCKRVIGLPGDTIIQHHSHTVKVRESYMIIPLAHY